MVVKFAVKGEVAADGKSINYIPTQLQTFDNYDFFECCLNFIEDHHFQSGFRLIFTISVQNYITKEVSTHAMEYASQPEYSHRMRLSFIFALFRMHKNINSLSNYSLLNIHYPICT